VVILPVATGGFGEARDYTMAYTARLLADLGPQRLEMAGVLGGPELNKTLSRAAPVTLLAEAVMFSLLGDNQAGQLAVLFAVQLAVIALAMLLAERWRPERRAGLLAGVIVALHPIAGGAAAGLSSLATMLAMVGMLGAMIFALSAVRTGRWAALAPMLLLAVLAAGADPAGILTVPAVLAVALCAPGAAWRGTGAPRAAAVILALFGVAMTALWMRSLGRPTAYLQALTDWRPAQFPVQAAWWLRGLLFAIDPTVSSGPKWVGPAAIAAPAAALTTATIVALRRRPTAVLWPVLSVLSLAPATLAMALPQRFAPPSSWAALYPAMIFSALWVAELWPGPEFPQTRVIVVCVALASVLPQSYLLTRSLADEARQTNRLGREFVRVVRDAPAGRDVILLADATSLRQLETVFLAANYADTSPRQLRYRMLVGGRLAPYQHALPSGELRGFHARLPFDDQKLFIGFDGRRRHMADLTGLIDAKVRLVGDEAATRRETPPALPLLDEAVINQWPDSLEWGKNSAFVDGATANEDQPSCVKWTLSWYVEGAMLRLNPYAGRELL